MQNKASCPKRKRKDTDNLSEMLGMAYFRNMIIKRKNRRKAVFTIMEYEVKGVLNKQVN